ncbi:hypothetical protein [Streptomyces sp. HUAS TT20]|nr:hypothetical protein [Streptomyces sp. HUAS 15-9]UXY32918.1 hypothetical protein N8I87_19180 [Streptomyces sp. HUAS 15-9]
MAEVCSASPTFAEFVNNTGWGSGVYVVHTRTLTREAVTRPDTAEPADP